MEFRFFSSKYYMYIPFLYSCIYLQKCLGHCEPDFVQRVVRRQRDEARPPPAAIIQAHPPLLQLARYQRGVIKISLVG